MIATIDLNIVMDVYGERAPFSTDSKVVLNLVEKRQIIGVFASHTLTTLFYLARRSIGRIQAESSVRYVLRNFQIVGLGRTDWIAAINAGFSDFEDAAVAKAADLSGSGVLITRNVADFAKSKVRAVTPTEFIWRKPASAGPQTPP